MRGHTCASAPADTSRYERILTQDASFFHARRIFGNGNESCPSGTLLRFGGPRAKPALAKPSRIASDVKCMLIALHDRRGITELEEGWLIRSLYRDDNLSQPAIAQRLGRDKSWVCRRLMLVESLAQSVQADVRLGLLVPRAAVAIGQLPRGNQAGAAEFAIRRGLTVRHTELFVGEIADCPDVKSQAQEIKRRLDGTLPSSGPKTKPKRSTRNEIDWISGDIHTLRQTAARLEARLLDKPLETFGYQAADLLRASLIGLAPVLCALLNTIDKVNAEKKEAA